MGSVSCIWTEIEPSKSQSHQKKKCGRKKKCFKNKIKNFPICFSFIIFEALTNRYMKGKFLYYYNLSFMLCFCLYHIILSEKPTLFEALDKHNTLHSEFR